MKKGEYLIGGVGLLVVLLIAIVVIPVFSLKICHEMKPSESKDICEVGGFRIESIRPTHKINKTKHDQMEASRMFSPSPNLKQSFS